MTERTIEELAAEVLTRMGPERDVCLATGHGLSPRADSRAGFLREAGGIVDRLHASLNLALGELGCNGLGYTTTLTDDAGRRLESAAQIPRSRLAARELLHGDPGHRLAAITETLERLHAEWQAMTGAPK